MTADEEEGMTIAQANSPLDADGCYTPWCRGHWKRRTKNEGIHSHGNTSR